MAEAIASILRPAISSVMPSWRSAPIKGGGFLPPGLGWDSGRWPLQIRKSGGVYVLDNQDALAQAQVNPAVWTGPAYYLDAVSGNDANNGLSWGAAVRTTLKARQLGQATGAPFRVMARKNQVFTRARGFNGGSNGVTVDHAVIVEDGGTSVFGVHDDLTYALDGTYTNCYSVSRSSVDRVFNLAVLDADGVYAEMPKYASPTALNTAGSVDGWAQSGSTFYVRRADGAAVTNANTRAQLAVPNYDEPTAPASIYLEGVQLEGGSTAAMHVQATGRVNVVSKRCRFGYAGVLTTNERDAYRMRNFDGLAMSIDDTAVMALKDGFNLHVDAGSNVLYGLFVNPKTRKIGTALNNSKNALTLHETARAIALNPDLPATINGSTVANVQDSTCLILGGTISADAGSGAGKGAIDASDNAKIWLVDTVVNGDIIAAGNAIIYMRNVQHAGNIATIGSGQVLPF